MKRPSARSKRPESASDQPVSTADSTASKKVRRAPESVAKNRKDIVAQPPTASTHFVEVYAKGESPNDRAITIEEVTRSTTGESSPLGATVVNGGVNFSVFS